ncbi:MAG: PAS domain S-box protein [Solirubrobacteraceae bacterium]
MATIADEDSGPVSERTEARQQPRETDQRFALLLEGSPDAIVIVDGEGAIVLLNAQAERMFGFPRTELLGRPVEALVPAGYRDAHARKRASYAADPGPITIEVTGRRRDGSELPVEITLSAVRTEGGPMVVSAIRDITARQAAHAVSAQLAAIVTASQDAIIAETLDGIIMAWNPAAERMFEYTAEQAIGLPIALFAPSELQRAEQRAFLAQAAAGSVVDRQESTRLARDGRVVDVEITVSPVRDRSGQITGACSFVRDIGERKQAEAALVEVREQFRYAFEDSPVGMAMLDLDFRLIQVNDACCRMLGYTREQLLAMRLESITHPDDIERERESMFAVLAGEHRFFVSEKRCVHASGHEITVAAHVTLLRYPGGRPMQFLAHFQDITDREHHAQQLEYLADHDALTGLPNHRAFQRELAAHASIVDRYGPAGAVLLLDLDRFAQVNRALGHPAGDSLIVSVAQALRTRLRSSDVLARLGGDSFAILLPKASAATACRVADGILEALHSEAVEIDGIQRPLTASIGIASFEGRGDRTGEDALVGAEIALSDAKQAGRNRAAVHRAEEPHARGRGRLTWKKRIEAALEGDGFTLLAQPVVHLATGRVPQYELLLRMLDETGELIAPESFLHIAERLGLGVQIDAWVISHAIRLLADRELEASDFSLELNLSATSIGDAVLLDHIERELASSQVDPSRLIFEISETDALGAVARATAFGERLSKLDCRFAVDDFGAGFGSFYHLKHMRFDLIKIDGALVRSCRSSSTDRMLIAAIVDIAGGLRTQTVAELVPDSETVALLARLGVDYGQGDHLGTPAPLHFHIATRDRLRSGGARLR